VLPRGRQDANGPDSYVALTRTFVHPRGLEDPTKVEMNHRVIPRIWDWTPVTAGMEGALLLTPWPGDWVAAINAGYRKSFTVGLIKKETNTRFEIPKGGKIPLITRDTVSTFDRLAVETEMLDTFNKVKAALKANPETAVCDWIPYRDMLNLHRGSPDVTIVMDIEVAYFLKEKLRLHRPATTGPLKMNAHLLRAIETAWRLRTSGIIVSQVREILGQYPPPFIPMDGIADAEGRGTRGLWNKETKHKIVGDQGLPGETEHR